MLSGHPIGLFSLLAGAASRQIKAPADDPAQRHDLAQVAQGQPVAEPAEHHEGDHVAGQASPVQHAGAALVELPPAGPAAEAAVAGSGDPGPLGHRIRATAHAVHPLSPTILTTVRPYAIDPDPANATPGARSDRIPVHIQPDNGPSQLNPSQGNFRFYYCKLATIGSPLCREHVNIS